MSTLKISVAAVEISEKSWVENSLPDGFTISSILGGDHYIYDSDEKLVGFVYVENGELVYVLSKKGQAFREAVVKKYPSYNPDRVVWGVFMDWYRMKGMLGNWSSTREEAVNQAREGRRNFSNVELCSVRAGDGGRMKFRTLTSYKLLENGEFSEQDDGPIDIELTNLENFFGEE